MSRRNPKGSRASPALPFSVFARAAAPRACSRGVADFAPRCRACGLDYTRFNVGDGPAAFLTMIVGALIVLLALWLHFTAGAPMWLIALLLVPLTAVLVMGGLRVGKAALLAAEFQRRAGEFQIHGDGASKP